MLTTVIYFRRYAGHEYTAGNLAFAKSVVGEEDSAIARLSKVVKENKITVGQATIGDEKAWNVFMRMGTDAVKYVFSNSILTTTPTDNLTPGCRI
jgi:hypothetical protein